MGGKAKQIDNDYQMIRTVSMRHAWHPKQDDMPDTGRCAWRGPTADPRAFLDDDAVCTSVAGALGIGDALFSDYSVWLQIDHMRICGNL